MLKKCFQGDPCLRLKSGLETSNSLDCLDLNHLFTLHCEGTYGNQHLISLTSNIRRIGALEANLEGDHRCQYGPIAVISASGLFPSHALLFHIGVPPTTVQCLGAGSNEKRNYEPKERVRSILSPNTNCDFSLSMVEAFKRRQKPAFSTLNEIIILLL